MKKSYKGLVLWLIIYLMGFVPMFGIDDGAVVTRLTLWYTSVMITALMVVIRNTDSIYWINGVYFEDAEKAGYEKRMEFAQKHLDKFKKHTAVYTIFTFASYFIKSESPVSFYIRADLESKTRCNFYPLI